MFLYKSLREAAKKGGGGKGLATKKKNITFFEALKNKFPDKNVVTELEGSKKLLFWGFPKIRVLYHWPIYEYVFDVGNTFRM